MLFTLITNLFSTVRKHDFKKNLQTREQKRPEFQNTDVDVIFSARYNN